MGLKYKSKEFHIVLVTMFTWVVVYCLAPYLRPSEMKTLACASKAIHVDKTVQMATFSGRMHATNHQGIFDAYIENAHMRIYATPYTINAYITCEYNGRQYRIFNAGREYNAGMFVRDVVIHGDGIRITFDAVCLDGTRMF